MYNKPGGTDRGNYKKKYTKSPGKKSGFKKKKTEKETEKIRLNKYIASTGLCSRREADTFIKAGLISVNGKTITELGTQILTTDTVKYNGEKLRSERLVYVLLNKPKDFITTVEDPHAKKIVLDLVKNACKERIYPVGRLDRNTTGVLLLTNDGELTQKLLHPSSQVKKIYHVGLDKSLKKEDMETIASGITLEDGFIKADVISYLADDKREIGIEIHSGRNRIIRRIFEQLGYKVTKLDRVFFAGLSKKGLSRGKWRYLTPREVGFLKMGSYK